MPHQRAVGSRVLEMVEIDVERVASVGPTSFHFTDVQPAREATRATRPRYQLPREADLPRDVGSRRGARPRRPRPGLRCRRCNGDDRPGVDTALRNSRRGPQIFRTG